MRVPNQLRDPESQGITVSTYEQDDRSVVAVDFGQEAGPASFDVVGDTVIVVAGDRQFEFDLPVDADDVSMNNAVLTIEG